MERWKSHLGHSAGPSERLRFPNAAMKHECVTTPADTLPRRSNVCAAAICVATVTRSFITCYKSGASVGACGPSESAAKRVGLAVWRCVCGRLCCECVTETGASAYESWQRRPAWQVLGWRRRQFVRRILLCGCPTPSILRSVTHSVNLSQPLFSSPLTLRLPTSFLSGAPPLLPPPPPTPQALIHQALMIKLLPRSSERRLHIFPLLEKLPPTERQSKTEACPLWEHFDWRALTQVHGPKIACLKLGPDETALFDLMHSGEFCESV